MSIPLPNTKELPGPFDAFATAKPGEPIFTLQGGDPLASQVVLHWAELARTTALHGSLPEAKSAALLIRATEAERVAWTMREYHEGTLEQPAEEAPKVAPDAAAKAAQDEHAARIRIAQRLDNALAEAAEMGTLLRDLGTDPFTLEDIDIAVGLLKIASDKARPARPAYMNPGKT